MFLILQGMVGEKLDPKACIEFEAEIYLLYHANKISKGFQVTLHVGNVCQTVIITKMDQVKKIVVIFIKS